MRGSTRLATRGVAVFLLAVSCTPLAHPLEPQPLPRPLAAVTADAPAKCCFTNPGYAGTCEVQPGKDESCSQVLDYLNNPMSQGKGYCGNTTLRGGWQSVACEPRK